jgi:hypothetical protein
MTKFLLPPRYRSTTLTRGDEHCLFGQNTKAKVLRAPRRPLSYARTARGVMQNPETPCVVN